MQYVKSNGYQYASHGDAGTLAIYVLDRRVKDGPTLPLHDSVILSCICAAEGQEAEVKSF